MIEISELRPELAEFLHQLGTIRAFSPKTIEAYTFDLVQFCAFLGEKLSINWKIENIDQYSIKEYIEHMADKGLAPITRGRRLATLKSFFRYLQEQGRINVNPASGIRMPKRRNKEPSYLTETEYKKLIQTVKEITTPYYKERDIAIVMTLLGEGLRLGEIVNLNVRDVSFTNSVIKITRKDDKETVLPLNNETAVAIKKYLHTRGNVPLAAPLFLSKRNERIDSASIGHLIKKYLRLSGIQKEKLSTHSLRHSFAAALLKKGESLFVIQQLLSHASIRSTERYLHIGGDDLRSAVDRISLSS